MDYNPYAAPVASPGPSGVAAAGQAQPWEVGEVIGIAWNTVKQHFGVLVFAPFLGQIVAGIPNQLPNMLQSSNVVAPMSTEFWIASGICWIVGTVVSTYVQVGLIRIYCSAARGQVPQFGDLFSGGSRFLPMLGTSFLLGLAVLCGYLLLIVPGVILFLGLSMAQYFCVDAETGAVESLKASWAATDGHKGALFLFFLASIGVTLLGCLACGVGIFVAIPVLGVAWAIIFTRISGRGAAPGMAQMYTVPAGPAWGPPPQ